VTGCLRRCAASLLTPIRSLTSGSSSFLIHSG
jgi:hypothetical protein